MKNHEQQRHLAADSASVQLAGRRAFIVALTGAASGAAFWALRSSSLFDPQPVEAADAPAKVTIVEFSANGERMGKITVPRIERSDAEWRQQLSETSYLVTRQAATERAYSGVSWNLHERGIFRCICCDTALFSSATKFDSGTGWPSFWQPIAQENVVESSDSSLGMERTAVCCRRCDAHLGHLFHDGPRPTGLRYCMNSAAMRFVRLA